MVVNMTAGAADVFITASGANLATATLSVTAHVKRYIEQFGIEALSPGSFLSRSDLSKVYP